MLSVEKTRKNVAETKQPCKVCWNCYRRIDESKDHYRGTHLDNGWTVLICEVCYSGYFQYMDSFDLNMIYDLISGTEE